MDRTVKLMKICVSSSLKLGDLVFDECGPVVDFYLYNNSYCSLGNMNKVLISLNESDEENHTGSHKKNA